jgi:preprotein translocase subunit YajC
MLLAQNTTNSNPLVSLLPLLLIFAAFFLVFIRPQQRRARAQRALLQSIEVGDEVVTGGGIFGHVVDIDEDEDVLTLEIAEGVEIRILRVGIGRKIETWDEDGEQEEGGEEEEDHAALEASAEHDDEGPTAPPIAPDQPEQSKDL